MKYVVKSFSDEKLLETFLNKERIDPEQIISIMSPSDYRCILVYIKRS